MDKVMDHPVCERCKRPPVPVRGSLLLDVKGLCFYCRFNIPIPPIDSYAKLLK